MMNKHTRYSYSALPLRLLDVAGIKSPFQAPINFVIERGDWSIKWDGHYITQGLNKIRPYIAKTTHRPYLLNKNIVHFGSQFQCTSWCNYMAKSNKMICTFFHGKREDDDFMAQHVDNFLSCVPKLEKIVTAAKITEDRLLSWGISREKLIRIPIGVDTNLFKPFSQEEKFLSRQKYGIQSDELVIGSFQKDGQGWDLGLDPKYIKGPDILVAVAKELSKHTKIVVFLTGPARGYVKKHLDDSGVRYIHEKLDDYLDLPARFAPLDVYINPSREEGGPKGIMEAMASGVFVVSTKVGMAPDIIQDGINGALVDVKNIDKIVSSILNYHSNKNDYEYILKQARHDILKLDWSYVAQQHYEHVYKDLLS